MSELKADLLRSRTNPDRPPAVQKADFVKAFVSFNMSSGAVHRSMNLSSLLDNGVGNWTVAYTTAFAGSWRPVSYGGITTHLNGFMFEAGKSNVLATNSANGAEDPNPISHQAFGDLA